MRPIHLSLIAACFLSACAGPAGDPYARTGSWNIEYNNDANLVAMVANPGDLQRGQGDGIAVGETAAAAVERYRAGRIRPLPASGVAEIKQVGTGGPSYGGAAQ